MHRSLAGRSIGFWTRRSQRCLWWLILGRHFPGLRSSIEPDPSFGHLSYILTRLLIRPGAIGDCILSLPVLEHLTTPDTEIWVPTPIVPLIRFAPRVRSIASTGLDLLGLPDIEPPAPLLAQLRSFDQIYSWYGARRLEFHEAALALGLPVTFFPALPPPEAPEHAADFFARQAGAPVPAIPSLPLTPANPPNRLVIHPFSGSGRKNWPLERYRAVAARSPLPVLWTAGPTEPLAEATYFDDLFALAQTIAQAGAYLGNDSGITHLAAATGAKVLAIFGPTDPAIWAPRGPNVTILHDNLAELNVAAVLDGLQF